MFWSYLGSSLICTRTWLRTSWRWLLLLCSSLRQITSVGLLCRLPELLPSLLLLYHFLLLFCFGALVEREPPRKRSRRRDVGACARWTFAGAGKSKRWRQQSRHSSKT
ncbi:unnamed protein product [Ectocarpus sp. 8 AP-2014]